MNKEQRIKSFINSDRTDYMQFFKNELEPERKVSGIQTLENSDIKKNLDRDKTNPEKYWMPNGVFGELASEPPYQELDFEMFSFNVLQKLSGDEDLNKTIEIIKDIPRTPRRKRFRIYLFESLEYVESPYFNPDLYLDIWDNMAETLNKVERMIRDAGHIILTKSFDSFSFIASTQEATSLQERINQSLDGQRLSLDTKLSAIKFYNIAAFHDPEHGWYTKKTTGTDYDKYKEEVIEHLKTLDFPSAFKVLARAKEEEDNNDKIREYVAKLNEIQHGDDYREDVQDAHDSRNTGSD